MIKDELIAILREKFPIDPTGHDWPHIERVYETAKYLQQMEGGELEVIELTALLHDISDHKFNGGLLNNGQKVAYELLRSLNCEDNLAKKVSILVDEISFKGKSVKDEMSCLESKIVQDADRLDAIGAIGIARAFAYGGYHQRPFYDPNLAPKDHEKFEHYAKDKSHTINHFYEKLLTLKDRMHTSTAKKMAEERHDLMITYLTQFYKEWNLEIQKNTMP